MKLERRHLLLGASWIQPAIERRKPRDRFTRLAAYFALAVAILAWAVLQ